MVDFAKMRADNQAKREKALAAAEASIRVYESSRPEPIPQAVIDAPKAPKPKDDSRDWKDDLDAAIHLRDAYAHKLNDWEKNFLKSIIFRLDTNRENGGLTLRQGESLDRMWAKHEEGDEGLHYDRTGGGRVYSDKNKPVYGSTRPASPYASPAKGGSGFDDMDDDIPF